MVDIVTNNLDVLIKSTMLGDITKVFQQDAVLDGLIPEAMDGFTLTSKGLEFVMYTKPEPPPRFSGAGAIWPAGQPLVDKKGRVRYTRIQSTLSLDVDSWVHLKTMTEREIIEDLAGRIQRHIDTDKNAKSYHSHGTPFAEVARVSVTPVSFTNVAVAFAESFADGNTFGVFKVFENTYYEWYSSAGVKRTGGGQTPSKCTARNNAATPPTATFDQVPTDVVATDRLVREGDFMLGLYGLDYFFVTSGVVQNLSVDTDPALRATKIAAAGQDFTAAIMSRLLAEGSFRIEGETMLGNRIILMAKTQEHAMELNGHPIRRADLKERTYDAAYTSVAYGGNQFVIDKWTDRSKVYTWTRGTIQKKDTVPYDMFDLEGVTKHLSPAFTSAGVGTHRAVVSMYFLWIGQNFCRKPNDLMFIEDLATDGLPTGKNG